MSCELNGQECIVVLVGLGCLVLVFEECPGQKVLEVMTWGRWEVEREKRGMTTTVLRRFLSARQAGLGSSVV
jgi:hypothetical protein